MTILMIIDDPSNGSSGYMLLHGSNADVGGYQIEGTVNKDEKGTITYDMTYTFNDGTVMGIVGIVHYYGEI